MTTITRERLLKIQQWREKYGPGSNVVLPAEEAEAMARELQQSRRILEGLPQLAIDGGWTAAGISKHTAKLERELQQCRAAAGPVIPDGLHPATADLVLRFATALAEKLHKAEQKYGYSDGWLAVSGCRIKARMCLYL